MKAWVMATGFALIAGSAHAQNMFAPPAPPPQQFYAPPAWTAGTNPQAANMHPYGYRGTVGSDGSAGFAMPRRDGGTDYMSQDGTWTGRSYGRR